MLPSVSEGKIPVVYARLLIVNDNEDILYTTQASLERAGFHVNCIQNPLEALEKFKPGVYDMVLIDMHMPEMDGITLLQRLRSIDSSVKACIFTASTEKDVLMEKLQSERRRNGTVHLQMPVPPRQIVAMIKRELGISLI